MPIHFTRHPENPIIVPGIYPWRMAVTFNPGVIFHEGRYYLYERVAGNLRPFICSIGAMVSDDGVHFTHLSDQPVLTTDMCGSKYGSVQDPRVTKIGDVFYMTFAWRPFAWSSHPTGIGVPESHETDFPGVARPEPEKVTGSGNVQGARPDNMTRSGLATSTDLLHWKFHSWITPETMDDRDVILFPEKIDGKYVVLRRPLQWVGPRYGTPGPSIWISYSDDLADWSHPKLVAAAKYSWEDNRVGGSTPPLRTPDGWLVLHHGVQTLDAKAKRVIYRLGAMLLDLHDPSKVIARLPEPIMEPEMYYEKFGLYIPNVIFPTGLIERNGKLMIYYGCCDTAISLATCDLGELLKMLGKHRSA